MKPPIDLILQLRDVLDVKTFVEGGTYYGNTAYWASQHFGSIITIEAQPDIYKATSEKYAHVTNIDFRLGNTRDVLREIVPDLEHPSIFWLDAHWSGGITYGEGDECPLLEELEIINQSEYPHYIFIDDAQFFLSPPPSPHKIEVWPTITQIVTTLNQKFNYYITVKDDVIIAVSMRHQQVVSQFLQDERTKEWSNTGDKPSVKSGLNLMSKGLKQVVNSANLSFKR